jgi:hypothetical protein
VHLQAASDLCGSASRRSQCNPATLAAPPPGAAAPPSAAPRPAPAGPPPDPWFALDKAQHVAFAAAVVLAAHALLRRRGLGPWAALAIAVAASVFAGFAKEVGDHLGWWPGNVSLRDLGADILGTALAAAAAATAERRRGAGGGPAYSRLPVAGSGGAQAAVERDIELGLSRLDD